MNTQDISQAYPRLKTVHFILPARELVKRILLALLFTSIGLLIYLVFSPMSPLLGRVDDYLGRIGLIVFLLGAVLLARSSNRFQKYGQVLLGLLIMAIAVSADRVFGVFLIVYLGVSDATAAGWAVLKLNECAVVVCTIILFTHMSGGSLSSIYIQKGNLRLGLLIGSITFLLSAAGSSIMADRLFKPQDLSLARIIPWLPWLLIFVLANAAQEELLFRGLFLRKLEPFFGKFLSNFLIAFVFVALHKGVTYTSNEFMFLAVTFPLALVWGAIMQKTNGVWGSILFHAGMDIPIMLGIFSNLV
jgi:membrane protease YdiL (CAAX protease family)